MDFRIAQVSRGTVGRTKGTRDSFTCSRHVPIFSMRDRELNKMVTESIPLCPPGPKANLQLAEKELIGSPWGQCSE